MVARTEYPLEALCAGDPVAWGLLGAMLLTMLAFGIVWLQAEREQRRQDEARKLRHGGGAVTSAAAAAPGRRRRSARPRRR